MDYPEAWKNFELWAILRYGHPLVSR